MKLIGTYQSRKICWFDYANFQLAELPAENWICLATSNTRPDEDTFSTFVRHAIDTGILEFKGHGVFGEKLHDLFDETMIDMEIAHGINFIDICTTFHKDESLANAFWQCFFATSLPNKADFDNLLLVCTDLEGIDRSEELKFILARFEENWIPEN